LQSKAELSISNFSFSTRITALFLPTSLFLSPNPTFYLLELL